VHECYELVLHRLAEARDGFNWGEGNKRVAIIFGDGKPHGKGYHCEQMEHPNDLDWREELQVLKRDHVTVYAVHCQPRPKTKPFYESLAAQTGGSYLTLADVGRNVQDVVDIIKAVAYRETGEERRLNVLYECAASAGAERQQLARNIECIRHVVTRVVEERIVRP